MVIGHLPAVATVSLWLRSWSVDIRWWLEKPLPRHSSSSIRSVTKWTVREPVARSTSSQPAKSMEYCQRNHCKDKLWHQTPFFCAATAREQMMMLQEQASFHTILAWNPCCKIMHRADKGKSVCQILSPDPFQHLKELPSVLKEFGFTSLYLWQSVVCWPYCVLLETVNQYTIHDLRNMILAFVSVSPPEKPKEKWSVHE